MILVVKMAMNKDILQILENLGIRLDRARAVKNGEEIQALCPFHEDQNPSFYLNIDKLVYTCFGCGARGHVTKLIQELTNLTPEQAKEAIQGIPHIATTRPPEQRGRYLTDQELDILTNYSNGLSGIMMGKLQGVDSGPWLEYLHHRGFQDKTIEYFKLGANAMKDYGAYFINAVSSVNTKTKDILKALRLTNDKGDYWFKPAVIIPYYSGGQCYFANARILPEYADGMKYVIMSGPNRDQFFNDDALDEYDDLFCVEGEFNAMSLWQIGFKNVVSFGGKQSFNDTLISSLYGRDIILYFDTDKGDPEFKARQSVIEKLQDTAKSIRYFELPEGTDINDYMKEHSSKEFVVYLIKNEVIVNDSNDFLSSEYRIIPESDRDKVISLSDAQTLNTKFFKNIADNFKNYAGSRILVNMPVGTGKTTAAVNLVNSRKEKTLVLTSTHYEANIYDEYLLNFDCFTIHLKGRSHADVGCPYAAQSENLCSYGYALKFKLDYCYGICSKRIELDEEESGACLHLNLLESAKSAGVLIATHAHGQLKDFFNNPYYGNKRRSLIIIDEQCDLINDVYFDKKTIAYNNHLLDHVAVTVATELSQILGLMEWARVSRQPFFMGKKQFSKQDIYEIEKDICRQITSEENLKPNKLYDLIYALENGIKFQYDFDHDSLYYTWRAKLPEKACAIFMSATTPQKYLEQVLGVPIDHVMGQQYDIRRENLQVIQMLNVTGGRWRLYDDSKFQDNVKAFFTAVLKKHKDSRIMLITSQGSNIRDANSKGSAKQRVIDMLDPIAKSVGRQLKGISTIDLEEGNIPDSFSEIPVIHFGIRGTNVFSDYDVLVELNAHYYNEIAITDGVKTIFNLDVQEQEPEKKLLTFRTQDKEYMIERYIHPDPAVRTYIEATQEGDIMQAEGRILRGEDTPKTIYRLHNVNIKPYPTKVYKSWESLMSHEFGIEKNGTIVKGKLKQVLDWVQDNRVVSQTFSTKEVAKALGGYSRDINRRYLKRLQEQGYISQRVSGVGQEEGAVWERKI